MNKPLFSADDLESLARIRNRNEKRVRNRLLEVMAEYTEFDPDLIDVEDIYALTLNQLPSRYTQERSVVLNEDVTEDMIVKAIRVSIEKVKSNPNY